MFLSIYSFIDMYIYNNFLYLKKNLIAIYKYFIILVLYRFILTFTNHTAMG